MSDLRQSTIVIGAGVIGCAIAYRLAREGRAVLLIDQDAPGVAGASYGNAGRIAIELVEPIPNVELLFNFWRDTFALGGVFDLPLSRLPRFAPWALEFARAAFNKRANTSALTPIVSGAVECWRALLKDIGAPQLLAVGGHYHFWMKDDAHAKAAANAKAFENLGIASEPASQQVMADLRSLTKRETAAGLWFPGSAHIVDPMQVCKALADAAMACGAQFRQGLVDKVSPGPDGVSRIAINGETIDADEIVICAGPHSASMLAPFGVRAPLEAARGYHIEMPGAPDHFGQSVIFMDNHLAMTPMAGRIRVSSYLDFVEPDAPADQRKIDRLVRNVRGIGYNTDGATTWHGSRSMLPDSLPGIGKAPSDHKVFYAIGGQMIGFTIAAGAADIVRDLVIAGGSSACAAFDLKRFA